MTQIGSWPARIVLPSVESWPWQMERMERTRLYQPRRAQPVAPAHREAITTYGERPDPRGWTRQAAPPRLQPQAPPDLQHVEDPGPELIDEHFLPAPSRGRRLRGLVRARLARIRLPRLRPIHVIIFTMGVVAICMVGLALWAWQSERDRAAAVHPVDLAQVPITVISISSRAEEGRATSAGAARKSRAARSFGQRSWSGRQVRRHVRRARRSRARRRQVDVDGILAAGQQAAGR